MNSVTVVVGQKGSGKTTILNMISAFGLYTTSLSTPLKLFELDGERRTDLQYNKWSDSALDIVYRNCLANARGPVFVDGLSRPVELEYLNNKGYPPCVIGVSAPENLRFERVVGRSREGEGALSLEVYREKCRRRMGNVQGFEANDLTGLMREEKYHIQNGGDLGDLFRKVKDMLRHLNHI